ncbi:hypothetical protein EIK77_009434 [Talaromyces pinophilus]|nr:hypothetical protein EIK77_009434 [Talaromyces pinophilus]
MSVEIVPDNTLAMDSSEPKANSSPASVQLAEEDSAIRDFYGSAISQSYRLKSELVAEHLAKIGMGNFSSVAYYVGMIIGATFWGTTADIIGRKPAFNTTIFLGGIFACAVAGSQNFVAFCALWAVIGTAAGGNVPVDSIIFLEFIPKDYQWLLVGLSGWWNLGQLIVSLLAWVFLANYACDSDQAPCPRADNMGWSVLFPCRMKLSSSNLHTRRYIMITLGAMAIAFGLIRIFIFRIPESPRYLISRGRDAEAVEAVNYIARYNGKPETLTLSMLEDIDRQVNINNTDAKTSPIETTRQSLTYILKENFNDFTADKYRKLFKGHTMAQHSIVVFLIWLTVGIGYPLYFAFITSYLETKSSYQTNSSLSYNYKIYCIVSAVGIIGPIAAAFLVESRFGRRWMMGLSAVLTGVFLFAYTAAKTQTADVGFQCATGILGNFGEHSDAPLFRSFRNEGPRTS